MNDIERQIKQFFNARGITMAEDYNKLTDPLNKQATYSWERLYNHGPWIKTLYKALINSEQIFIVGDYDVDGIFSATVVYQSLKQILNKNFFDSHIHLLVPSRQYGYGFNQHNINDVIQQSNNKNITFILTDNGITAFQAFNILNQLQQTQGYNFHVIVADHHECKPDEEFYQDYYINQYGTEPSVNPVFVDPYMPQSEYPFKGLSATGVAYKLMVGFFDYISYKHKKCKMTDEFMEYLQTLVGVTVISDVCSSVNENRYYLVSAINALNKYQNDSSSKWFPILQAMNPYHNKIDGDFIGFTIAPILNSNSRMLNNCAEALSLFNNDNVTQVSDKIQTCIQLNNERKELVNHCFQKLLPYTKQFDTSQYPVLVFNADKALGDFLPNHYGIIGLLANKIASYYSKPTILLTSTHDGSGLTGSARTANGIALMSFVNKVKTPNMRYGGHDEAFGVTYIPNNEVIEFRNNLLKVMHSIKVSNNLPYDFELSDTSIKLITYLNQLAPFGVDFGKPIYHIKTTIKPENIIYFGNQNQHVKYIVEDKNGKQYELKEWNNAIYWQNHPFNSVNVDFYITTGEFRNEIQFLVQNKRIENNN